MGAESPHRSPSPHVPRSSKGGDHTDKRYSASIVAYNSRDEISGALDSLLGCRQAAEMDICVIDNASPGQDAEFVREKYPTVRVVKSAENLGFGKAHNLLLPELMSEYHLMVNPDITFEADALTHALELMGERPDTVAVTPRVMNTDGTEQFLPRREQRLHYMIGGRLEGLGGVFKKWRREYTRQDEPMTKPTPVEYATGCFMLVRTEAFKALGGFDPRYFLYCEDADLSRSLTGMGTILYDPDFVVTHDWRRDSAHTGAGTAQMIKSLKKYFDKWGWKW